MARKTPAPFLIVKRFKWHGEEKLMRQGVAKTRADAQKVIAATRRELGNTYGGLIAAPKPIDGSTYEIWEAVGGWRQVHEEDC